MYIISIYIHYYLFIVFFTRSFHGFIFVHIREVFDSCCKYSLFLSIFLKIYKHALTKNIRKLETPQEVVITSEYQFS